MDQQLLFTELKFILEALLMAAPKPLSIAELRDVLARTAEEDGASEAARAFRKLDNRRVEGALEELARDHLTAGRSYRVACVAGVWQFVTLPEFAPWVRTFLGVKNRPARLSLPALETLAVIAYRQPVTRAEMEQIRGVAVDGVIATLKERGLVEEVGRAEIVGRPMQYGTTSAFLEYFGLANLDGLPAADELRRIPVSRPEVIATAEPAQTPVAQPTVTQTLVDQLPLAVTDSEAAALAPESPSAPDADSPAPDSPMESEQMFPADTGNTEEQSPGEASENLRPE